MLFFIIPQNEYGLDIITTTCDFGQLAALAPSKDFMGWTFLILAGFFEIAFTTFLKLSNGFTRPIPSLGFLVSSLISFYLLTKALATIELGTAYAVWTGIGAFGTAIIGILFFGDSTNFWRLFFLFLLIASIVGLKLAAPMKN